ncbi:hypothetical protein [Saccharothrix sp. ALI-22-I]|uniref:hypothetical protein n=1 Tax=Saccharothrix sp. ALI-22-I TaxID=1933778 RepID=UPI0019310906|nr:hypothetical protein [Saccharothrix sp. ALI-22-I]
MPGKNPPTFLEHGPRHPHITGVTTHQTQAGATQQAGNLAADLGTRTESPCFLLRDRDGKYGRTFDTVFQAEELHVITSAPRAPRMNAHCERVIGTVRREVLDHILILGRVGLRMHPEQRDASCLNHVPRRALKSADRRSWADRH